MTGDDDIRALRKAFRAWMFRTRTHCSDVARHCGDSTPAIISFRDGKNPGSARLAMIRSVIDNNPDGLRRENDFRLSREEIETRRNKAEEDRRKHITNWLEAERASIAGMYHRGAHGRTSTPC